MITRCLTLALSGAVAVALLPALAQAEQGWGANKMACSSKDSLLSAVDNRSLASAAQATKVYGFTWNHRMTKVDSIKIEQRCGGQVRTATKSGLKRNGRAVFEIATTANQNATCTHKATITAKRGNGRGKKTRIRTYTLQQDAAYGALKHGVKLNSKSLLQYKTTDCF